MATRVPYGLAVLGIVALVAAPPAAAQFWQATPLCASSNLAVCASVTVVQGPSNTLTVTVVNTGSAGTLFTIGLFNFPSWNGSYQLVSATKNGGPVGNVTSQWKKGEQSLNNAIDWGVVKNGAAQYGVNPGETVVFVLTFSPDFNITSNTQLAWHAGALQVSEKCITGNTGDHACSPQVVPEPVTLLLLGSGLAGLGGAKALRRRRKGVEVESA